MIVWREKFHAFGLHFTVTLAAALAAAALIFLVWFPSPLDEMTGGFKLFLLISGCDLALGPLLSLIVYNSRKTRLALTVDYTAIALLQISALVYGIYSIAEARPAYIVFAKDRLDVVIVKDIRQDELDAARGSRFATIPKWGPELVAVVIDPKDHNDALFAALNGRDVSVRPKFFVDYVTQLHEVKRRAQPLSELEKKGSDAQRLVAEAISRLDRPASDFGWIPVAHPRGFWTVLIDRASGYPAGYIPLDPY